MVNLQKLIILLKSLGTFGANEQIISLGLGKELSELWSVGASVKTLFSNLYDYQSIAIASDLAIAYIKRG